MIIPPGGMVENLTNIINHSDDVVNVPISCKIIEPGFDNVALILRNSYPALHPPCRCCLVLVSRHDLHELPIFLHIFKQGKSC